MLLIFMLFCLNPVGFDAVYSWHFWSLMLSSVSFFNTVVFDNILKPLLVLMLFCYIAVGLNVPTFIYTHVYVVSCLTFDSICEISLVKCKHMKPWIYDIRSVGVFFFIRRFFFFIKLLLLECLMYKSLQVVYVRYLFVQLLLLLLHMEFIDPVYIPVGH